MVKAFRLLGKLTGFRQHLMGDPARLVSRFGYAGDVGRNLLGAAGGLLDIAGDLAGRGALLFDRRRDGGGTVADSRDGCRDVLNGSHRLSSGALDGGYLAGDFLGRLGGLVREVLDFGGYDGEALAGFPGPRRLDRGVQRQKVGLAGDIVDQADDLTDLLGGIGQAGDDLVGAFRLDDGVTRRFRRLKSPAGRFR